jgi:hypothetical protein
MHEEQQQRVFEGWRTSPWWVSSRRRRG